MSASASSVSMISMSRSGSTLPETCTTLSSAKQRTTCTMASVSRMLARNWLPRPSPFEAPATRPAMSTNSTMAGWIFCGLTMADSCGEARVRHLDDADVRLDGAERIVGRVDAGLGQGVEEGGFADVGQADDAAFQRHGFSWVCQLDGFAVQLLLGAGKVAGGKFRPGQQAAGEGVFDVRQFFLARRVQHEIDHLLRQIERRADGRCRGAGARNPACRAAPGCPSGRCGRRCRRPA